MSEDNKPNGTAAPAPSTLVKLPGTGKNYDLSQAFPLTLGDWAEMEEAGVIDKDNNIKINAKNAITMLTYLLQKVDPTVQREHVAQVPMTTLNVLGSLLTKMSAEDAEAPRPTSPPS